MFRKRYGVFGGLTPCEALYFISRCKSATFRSLSLKLYGKKERILSPGLRACGVWHCHAYNLPGASRSHRLKTYKLKRNLPRGKGLFSMSRAGESDAHHVWDFMHSTGMIRDAEDTKTRHEYKEIAAEKGLSTSSERSSITPLTNQKTIDKYKGILKEFRHFSRVNGFGNNLRTLPGEAASAFLSHKAEDVGRQRLQDICSCITKAGAFGGNANFAPAVEAFRKDEMPPKAETVSRAFDNPQEVISNIKSDGAKLAAEIQLRTGLRADNALSFKINASGDTVSFVSKGGIRHEAFPMPQDLIDRSRAFADPGGNVSIMPYRSYEYQVKNAATASGERLTDGKVINSHGFRHCFARDMYNGLIKSGVSKAEAKAEVSEALFHHRQEITDLYIR